MPTCDFYIRCPYFVAYKDKGATITCEDTTRHFGTTENRNGHIKSYCEPGRGCPHATTLDELYERMDHMNEAEARIAKLEHENNCKATEITKLKKQLTHEKQKAHETTEKAEKRVRQQDLATRYIVEAKDKEIRRTEGRMSENDFINSQRIRALELYIGYLHMKYKLKSFRLGKVRDFGLKYEVLCKIPDLEDDLVLVEIKEKQDDTARN